MVSQSGKWSKRFLVLCAAYYLICAVTAFFWPGSWFWAGGIVPTDRNQAFLLMAVIGAPMFALFVAAALAARHPASSQGLLWVLFAHNVLDGMVNVHAGFTGLLPPANSAGFAAVALSLAIGLGILIRRDKELVR